MKRFLSWIVLLICSYVSLLACSVLYRIVLRIIYWLMGSRLALVLVVLLGGGGTLTFGLVILIALAHYTTVISDAVCRSENGLRYKVVGGIAAVVYTVGAALIFFGLANSSTACTAAIANIIYALYGIVLIFAAKER